MTNLTHPGLIKLKGVLFLLLALLSTAMLYTDHPDIRFLLLFGIAVWSFCRFYYFAFYVITKYVDPTYRFSGLGAFAKYLICQSIYALFDWRHTKTDNTAINRLSHNR